MAGGKGAEHYIQTFLVFYGDHNWKSLFLRVAAKISSGNSVENDENVGVYEYIVQLIHAL
jgi:hypothetical protein